MRREDGLSQRLETAVLGSLHLVLVGRDQPIHRVSDEQDFDVLLPGCLQFSRVLWEGEGARLVGGTTVL